MAAKKQDLAEARWDDIRLFLALHRQGSLGRAATRLGLDTSTLSRRLSALEDALGARLFERTREGLSPTRRAERVLAAAEAMEAAHGHFARDASGADAEPEGVVRLSVVPGMADVFIAPALVRLRAQHPRIRIELDAAVRARDLARHEADVALRVVPPQGADLLVTKVLAARSVAAASADLVARLGVVTAWAALPWITWDADLATLPAARWIARHAARGEVVLRTSHFGAQLVAAETGLGVVLVPAPYCAVRELVPVRYARSLAASAATWPTDQLWVVTPRVLRDVPRVAAVRAFFVDELRRAGA